LEGSWLTEIAVQVVAMAERNLSRAKKTEQKVVLGIEPRLPESESDVLTITLYNRFWF
jgi:hypothetical protein